MQPQQNNLNDEEERTFNKNSEGTEENSFRLSKGDTIVFGGLLIIIFLLYIPLLFLGVSYFYTTFGTLYGDSLVFIAFGIFSLVASIILFGFLKSSGVVKTPQYQFGGAAALFIVTLSLLIWRIPEIPKEISLKGIVYIDNKVQPDVKVLLQEAELSRRTNEFGVFEMVINESNFQENYTFVISSQDREIEKTFIVKHNELDNLRFYLESPLQTEPSLRKEIEIISSEEAQRVFRLNEKWQPIEYIENEFTDIGEAVIDHATKLIWQKSGSDEVLTYKAAYVYIEKLNREKFAGYADWRLPTIAELITLLESTSQSNVYINSIFNKTQFACWSSDPLSSEAFWSVDFSFGNVRSSSSSSTRYVRAVRSQ